MAAAPLTFVGALTWDSIALVDSYPARDQRVVARDIVSAGGGPAATAAVAAARLGTPAAVVGAVGDDEEGRAIVAALEAEGVATQGVSVEAGSRSGASVIVVDAAAGTRAICTRPVPPPTVNRAGAALLESAPWVHVDHLGWGTVAAWRAGTGARFRLSVDAGNPIAGLELGGVDLFVPTTDALRRIYGDLPDADLLGRALAGGARTVVATRGSRGALGATADGDVVQVPVHPVDVVSTLGAGDVFHGALLAAVHCGLALADALRYANVAAALSCRAVDGRSAIPTHDELLASLGETAEPNEETA